MRLGLRKLMFLHELTFSRKNRISKSVYCDTHMPAAYVPPFLYDTPSSYESCCNKQHTLRLSNATFWNTHMLFSYVLLSSHDTLSAYVLQVLYCAAVYCSVLQCVAVCCSVLQCVAVPSAYVLQGVPLQHMKSCSVEQRVATYILCLFFMTSLIHTCDITHSHERHDSCRCATWLTNPKGCFDQYHPLTHTLHICLFAEYISLL